MGRGHWRSEKRARSRYDSRAASAPSGDAGDIVSNRIVAKRLGEARNTKRPRRGGKQGRDQGDYVPSP